LFLLPVGATLLGTVLMAVSPHQKNVPDFDGDGRPDIAMWRPPLLAGGAGTFYAITAKDNFATTSVVSATLGTSGDIQVVGDYDGDGKTDLAVYSPSTNVWSIRYSSQGYTSIATYQWGTSGDIPVPADYDGDGKTDMAVFRPIQGRWYVLLSKTGFTSGAFADWGSATSIPVPGDYDGDGKCDLATVEGSDFFGLNSWYVLLASTNFKTGLIIQGMGGPNTTPVPNDYDGDGKVDAAVYDPLTSTFTVRTARDSVDSGSKQWGIVGDIPVPADYDGDGKTDLGVFRPGNSTYYVLLANTSFTNGLIRTFGLGSRPGDQPVLRR
jgi:hypothetical protein